MTNQDWINLNMIRCMEETYALLAEMYGDKDARVARIGSFLESASHFYSRMVPDPEDEE